MKRREFLKSSVVAGVAAILPSLSVAAAEEKPASTAREFYELRLYHLRRGPMQKRFDDFYEKAAIPAMNRIGISPVGVFNLVSGPDSPTMYVLIPHKTIDSLATATDRLRADADYLKAGGDFINAPSTDPSYLRVESSLMVAFESIPKLEVPEKKSRIFELRTYESHSKKASKTKIEMFNKGEIDIFRRVGIRPVFFGETMVGTKMPNLTYMVVFDDVADREKRFATFGADPEWQKLKSKPEYADSEVVSNVSNLFLRPAAYSQI